MYRGGVGQNANLPAQGGYLVYQLALAGAAHRRVAGHQPDAVRVAGQQRHPRPQLGRRQGCLQAGVPGADHYHVVGFT